VRQVSPQNLARQQFNRPLRWARFTPVRNQTSESLSVHLDWQGRIRAPDGQVAITPTGRRDRPRPAGLSALMRGDTMPARSGILGTGYPSRKAGFSGNPQSRKPFVSAR